MELIASVDVGSGGAASIEFTSIPATFTDLCVKVSSRSSATSQTFGYIYITFNAATTNLSSKVLYGYGSGQGSLSITGQDAIFTYNDTSISTSSTFGNCEFYIPNYANGSVYKSVSLDGVNENNATDARQTLTAGLWSSTAAITSIQLNSEDNSAVPKNFLQYSSASLYGIKYS